MSQEDPYLANTFIVDNYYSGHNFLAQCENFKPNLLLYSGQPIFNFQMILFDPFLYFSTTLLTLLYLVSHQELHEFLELKVSQYSLREIICRIVQNRRVSRNLLLVKFPRNLHTAGTWL